MLTAETEDEKNSISVYNLLENRVHSYIPLEEIAGTLMPVGAYVIGFFGHSKIIDPRTGKVIDRWIDLNTGKQNSSIVHHIEKPPPLALDVQNRRFAVAGTESITILQLS